MAHHFGGFFVQTLQPLTQRPQRLFISECLQGNFRLVTRYAVNTGSLGRGAAGSLRAKISELTTAQSVECPTVLLVLPVERLCPQETVIMQ